MDEVRRSVVSAKVEGAPPILVEVRTGTTTEAEVGLLDGLDFDGITESIKAIAKRMRAALDEVKPDGAAIEFGVDLSVESGTLSALLVKGTGAATVKITLEWAKPQRP